MQVLNDFLLKEVLNDLIKCYKQSDQMTNKKIVHMEAKSGLRSLIAFNQMTTTHLTRL